MVECRGCGRRRRRRRCKVVRIPALTLTMHWLNLDARYIHRAGNRLRSVFCDFALLVDVLSQILYVCAKQSFKCT